MQQRFAEFLVFGGPDGPMTQTEAALAAGYSPKRARQEGSELCNPKHSPLVVKYIGQLKEERLKKHEVTYEGHVAELARLREAALKKGSFSSAVNAEANRGKAAGLYIDRKIIKTGKFDESEYDSALFAQVTNEPISGKDTYAYQNFINKTLRTNGFEHLKCICFNPNDTKEVAGFNARKDAPYFLINIAGKKVLAKARELLETSEYLWDKAIEMAEEELGIGLYDE